MKKRIADKLVEALRSGKYEQGKGQLKKDNKFCCLGVLCDISKKSEWDYNSASKATEYDDEEGLPPDNVIKWAGLNSRNGMLSSLDISLVALNDGNITPPLTFDEIADIIQINYKEL